MTSSADHADPPEGFDQIPMAEFQDRDGLSNSDLAPAAARKIDDLCDQFEKAWMTSSTQPPQVESYWKMGGQQGLSVSAARVLLKELLIIDLNYRKKHGSPHTPDLKEYLARFPNSQELIQDAFRLAGGSVSAGLSAPAGEETSRVPVETSSDFRLVPSPEAHAGMPDHLKSTINEMPRQLGGYTIEEELGHGGMGVVYRARDEEMNRTVAIKVMKEDKIASREAIERFRREIRLLANLDHENIVRAYHTHVDEATRTRYLVMEYVEGVELETLVRDSGQLSIPDACEIIRQAALGLEHAHQNALIHRDLKPANLMLTSKGQIKVLDLGLARPQSPAEAGPNQLLTQEGQWLGTPYFMSPEQGVLQGKIDHRSDIYSLGCTLYRFLAGQTPFGHQKDATVLAILMQHANDEFPRVTDARPEVPKGLQKLLGQMVEKSPADRLASAAEVARRLEPYAKGSDLNALFQTYRSGGIDLTPSSSPKTSWKRWAIAGASLLAIVIIAAIFLWSKPNPPVDLLSKIDIHRDPVQGDWHFKDGVLTSPPASQACLRLPETLPAEFRLEIATRRKGIGMTLMFVHRSDETPFALALLPVKAVPVDGELDRRDAAGNSGPIFEDVYDYKNPGPQTLVFDVKKERLTIARDGDVLVDAENYSALPSEDLEGVPDRPGFYLVTNESEFEFSKIVLSLPE